MLEVVWLIPLLPLAGFALLLVGGRRIGDPLAGWLATSAVAGSFVTSVLVFASLWHRHAGHRAFTKELFTWVPAGGLQVKVGFLADPLSMTMALFVTGVGALIHLYSIGYMHGDPKYSKFFVYMNLFTFSMLMLVLGNNLLVTFLGWEGVGACSYFLIAFWFERPENAAAGVKAFVVNAIGDVGLFLATFLIFWTFGRVDYDGVFKAVQGNQGEGIENRNFNTTFTGNNSTGNRKGSDCANSGGTFIDGGGNTCGTGGFFIAPGQVE